MAKQKMKVFGYIRVSGKGQLNGYGPERQRDDIERFCKAQGFDLVAVYTDAHTGTEEDRPEFFRMLGDILANGVETIVVESLDRFARESVIQTTLLAKLEAEHISLYAANTGDNVTESMKSDPMKRAMIQIQGVFAELDKNQLVRKLRKGRQAKRAQTGMKVEGRKKYGEKPGEEKVIERIRELRRKPKREKRRSLQQVADTLNQEGLLNRSGGDWTRQSLHSVMKSVGIA